MGLARKLNIDNGMKLLIVFTVLIFQAAQAEVALNTTQPIQLPQAPAANWTQADIGKVIPTDMQDSNDQNAVANRIGDHAIQNWLNSPVMRNSSVGRTAHQVQDAMKTEVVVQGGSSSGKASIDHKFSFQVLALQASSRLKYTGWLNAQVNFDSRARETIFEVTEKVWDDKDFVISHTANQVQDLSSVGLRWSW